MKLLAKRCPFCNSHNLTIDVSAISFWVKCHNCSATGPCGFKKESSLALWNGHHKHSNPAALVANRKSNHHQMKEIE